VKNRNLRIKAVDLREFTHVGGREMAFRVVSRGLTAIQDSTGGLFDDALRVGRTRWRAMIYRRISRLKLCILRMPRWRGLL